MLPLVKTMRRVMWDRVFVSLQYFPSGNAGQWIAISANTSQFGHTMNQAMLSARIDW
jgi:hypothetical protein